MMGFTSGATDFEGFKGVVQRKICIPPDFWLPDERA
jgi:hypothetical protein